MYRTILGLMWWWHYLFLTNILISLVCWEVNSMWVIIWFATAGLRLPNSIIPRCHKFRSSTQLFCLFFCVKHSEIFFATDVRPNWYRLLLLNMCIIILYFEYNLIINISIVRRCLVFENLNFKLWLFRNYGTAITLAILRRRSVAITFASWHFKILKQ